MYTGKYLIASLLTLVVAMLGVACGGASEAPTHTPQADPSPTSTSTVSASPRPETPVPTATFQPTPTPKATHTPIPTPTQTMQEFLEEFAKTPQPTPTLRQVREKFNHVFFEYEWGTDYTKAAVPFSEISLVIPRDAIPPIYEPDFISVREASDVLHSLEPVIVVEINGEARAYPKTILVSHEIVNDVLGDTPIAVTWCPLCDTSFVFSRSIDGRTFRFGVSGLLRDSNLIMWDWETESWWQQGTAEAIVGAMAGTSLLTLPFQVVAFKDFKAAFPEGEVLQGPFESYHNPYYEYDATENPFLFSGDLDQRLPPAERVIGISTDNESRAYPFSELAKDRVVHASFAGRDFVIFYHPGTLSTLDKSSVQNSRAVGSATVFVPAVDGQMITFEVVNDEFVDHQTNSRWNMLGQAVEGPLKGKRIPPLVHGEGLWFYWAAAFPDTSIYRSRR